MSPLCRHQIAPAGGCRSSFGDTDLHAKITEAAYSCRPQFRFSSWLDLGQPGLFDILLETRFPSRRVHLHWQRHDRVRTHEECFAITKIG